MGLEPSLLFYDIVTTVLLPTKGDTQTPVSFSTKAAFVNTLELNLTFVCEKGGVHRYITVSLWEVSDSTPL